ncbi:MAG: hypothetical protein M3282_11325 [Gemmatimonadota bacterium]|nr:hypothetical protein [Gemmatimonadota bacterium]
MIGLLGVLLTIALAIGVTAGSLFGLRDRSVLASAPESAVEDFVRKLATKRYVRAHGDLNDDVAKQVSPDSLRSLIRALENRVGEIVDVRGERLWMTRTSARAAAVLTTSRRREFTVEFPLMWSNGEWAVADMRGLEQER